MTHCRGCRHLLLLLIFHLVSRVVASLMNSRILSFVGVLFLAPCVVVGREYNVATSGDDSNDGSLSHPLRTVQFAATVAAAGDVVTVHAGVYRERVYPPNGGVTFQAASGDAVTISGAEPAGSGWSQSGSSTTWSLVLPSYATFGTFNPYSDRIRGDWFDGKGLIHHTGAVYLADTWMLEATSLAAVLAPLAPGAAAQWFGSVDGDVGAFIVNLLSITPHGGAAVSAGSPSWRYGTKPFASAAGPCAASIYNGDLLRFDGVDFGSTPTTALDLSAAAAVGAGATLEVHAGDRWGPLLGSLDVPATGGWEAWANFTVPIVPTSGLQNISIIFLAPGYDVGNTTIYAQFGVGVNPNAVGSGVEINVRQTVFYPAEPFIDNITVRGFTLERAATQWAPPSAEQIAIIGTHWSKGWVIEDNQVRHSAASCVSLGKYGDGYDNTNDNGEADPYTACVERALAYGWHKDTIGSHVVRNNYIHHCGQTGVVGSLGGAFSSVVGNEIHDCNYVETFGGEEQAGVKLHGAVDAIVADNHIYRCNSYGIWFDWMAQGTMVIGNLVHESKHCDIFMEVDHGPTTVANNIFLTPTGALCADSAGGAFLHNIIAGTVEYQGADTRHTPSLVPHGTDIVVDALANNGDSRLYNNLVVAPGGFAVLDDSALPCFGSGNVYTGGGGSGPSKFEGKALVNATFDAGLQLTQDSAGVWYLSVNLDPQWPLAQPRVLVTTALLGNASIPNQAYTTPDAAPFVIAKDYFGVPRNEANPFPGPLEWVEGPGAIVNEQVWPKSRGGARPGPMSRKP